MSESVEDSISDVKSEKSIPAAIVAKPSGIKPPSATANVPSRIGRPCCQSKAPLPPPLEKCE